MTTASEAMMTAAVDAMMTHAMTRREAVCAALVAHCGSAVAALHRCRAGATSGGDWNVMLDGHEVWRGGWDDSLSSPSSVWREAFADCCPADVRAAAMVSP